MTEKPLPKILILDANDALRERAKDIMEDQGWEVCCESVSKIALERLEQSKEDPFHLFISNFKLPKMEGDDILKHARSISPLTQRMLMVPSDQSDMVIRAINKAGINACIATPAADQDLLDRTRACLRDFRREMKHEQLKRVIRHQNKQMFTIAQRLKKKDQLFRERINGQNEEKKQLSTKLRHANRAPKDPTTLEARVRAYKLSMLTETLEAEFHKLAGFTHTLFSNIASEAGLNPPDAVHDVPTGLAQDDPEGPAPLPPVIEKLLGTIFSSPADGAIGTVALDPGQLEEMRVEDLVEVRISEDQTRAFVKRKTEAGPWDKVNLETLLELLLQNEITFGIEEDAHIESWITSAAPGDEAFQIARGKDPDPGRDGRVDYRFAIDYSNPGKIMDSGRIDFRDRGDIPYVHQGDLLAVKTPPKPCNEGMSVKGEVISVEEPFDPVFVAGNGTELSEDGLQIHSGLDGRPHLDPLGELSVNPELAIDGDVDFKTGNIDFNGNIVVQGTVKEGFTVKGISLTAAEVEGATISLSGDLCVSDGITDATVTSVGNVYAKFINNSTLNAYGDIVVNKEVIDSDLLLSGQFKNTTGIVLASRITAKAGIDAGKIGTETSKPARLKVGTDDHVESREQALEDRLKQSRNRLQEIRHEMDEIEHQDQALYGQITEKAQDQERVQSQIASLEKELAEFKRLKDQMGVDQAQKDIKTLSAALKKSDRELNRIFNVQDKYARKLGRFKQAAEAIEETNKSIVLQKKGLRDFASNTVSVPEVLVQGRITQETVVQGPNSTLTLKDTLSRCRIAEKNLEQDGIGYFKMEVSDL